MTIPESENPLVLLTDFSNVTVWKIICTQMMVPNEHEFYPRVDFCEAGDFDSLSVEKLLTIIPKNYRHQVIFLVDAETISNKEHPILCVDLADEPGRKFRVIPSELWGVENNISTHNMYFAEFADHVQSDGIFRGFN